MTAPPERTTMRVTCPCGKVLTLDDKLAGKRVRCPACREVLTVSDAGGESPPPPSRAAAPEEPDDSTTRPRKKKRKKEASSAAPVLLAGAAAFLLIAGVVAATLVMRGRSARERAQGA